MLYWVDAGICAYGYEPGMLPMVSKEVQKAFTSEKISKVSDVVGGVAL